MLPFNFLSVFPSLCITVSTVYITYIVIDYKI